MKILFHRKFILKGYKIYSFSLLCLLITLQKCEKHQHRWLVELWPQFRDTLTHTRTFHLLILPLQLLFPGSSRRMLCNACFGAAVVSCYGLQIDDSLSQIHIRPHCLWSYFTLTVLSHQTSALNSAVSYIFLSYIHLLFLGLFENSDSVLISTIYCFIHLDCSFTRIYSRSVIIQ